MLIEVCILQFKFDMVVFWLRIAWSSILKSKEQYILMKRYWNLMWQYIVVVPCCIVVFEYAVGIIMPPLLLCCWVV